MQFCNIVGLANAKAQLINLVTADRIPHAILLNGQKGNGGLPMGIAFAQYIMCTAKTATDSCGACPNCQKFSKLQHIDVHYSFPVIANPAKEPGSIGYYAEFRKCFLNNAYMDLPIWMDAIEADKKQGNITAKECRDIIKKLQLRSFEGGYKILIMWLPEFMGTEGNILLKLIEEPPAKTIMLFVTENYDKVLGTIQSRTQLINLPPLSDVEIYEALIAKGIATAAATQLARIVEGDYGLALQSAAQKEDGYLAMFREWLNVLFTNNGVGINNWVLQVADMGKETQKQYLAYVGTMMEHLIRSKWVGQDNLLLNADEAQLLQKMMAIQITEHKANIIATTCADGMYHIERNANAKIVFQSISLKVKDVFTSKSLYL
jgi:DNA polymerase III subunit delta'